MSQWFIFLNSELKGHGNILQLENRFDGFCLGSLAPSFDPAWWNRIGHTSLWWLILLKKKNPPEMKSLCFFYCTPFFTSSDKELKPNWWGNKHLNQRYCGKSCLKWHSSCLVNICLTSFCAESRCGGGGACDPYKLDCTEFLGYCLTSAPIRSHDVYSHDAEWLPHDQPHNFETDQRCRSQVSLQCPVTHFPRGFATFHTTPTPADPLNVKCPGRGPISVTSNLCHY